MKSSRRGTGMKGLGLVLVLGAGLVGCAVLTVDVDVYKGALVNEEHVQLHQLTALATAAKPMLVQLRDKLEWPREDGIPYPKYAICSLGWYRPLYVEPPHDFVSKLSPGFWGRVSSWFKDQKEVQKEVQKHCPLHFENIRARLVNSVLSLYEDLESPDLSPYGLRLRDIVRDLEKTIPNPQADKEALKKISSGFKSDTDLNRDGLTKLKEGYEEFLSASDGDGVPRRSIESLMYALSGIASQQGLALRNETTTEKADGTTLEEKLIQFWSKSKKKLPEKQDLEKQLSKEESNKALLYDRQLPSRASWKYLGEGRPDSLLAQASAKLCKDDSTGKSSCEDLLDRTKKLVDDYWKFRQATHDLWEEGLHLLVLIQRLDWSQPERYSKLRKQLLDLILSLTSIPYVASALDRVQGTEKCTILKSLSVRDLKCGPRSDGPLGWTSANITDNELRKALTVHPEETAYFLLYLDSIEQDAPPSGGDSTILDLVKTANETDQQRPIRLGLTLSLVDTKDVLNSTALFELVNQVSHGLAQGFERGRPVEGLHRLTETFLASHNGTNRTREGSDQKKLTDALVEFAQKVLFLANHDWLVSPPGSAGLILGGGESLLRGLFGDGPADRLSRSNFFGFGTSRVPQAEEQAYIRVLQAVGNSILLYANELRERDRYADESIAKVPTEVMAARSVYSPDPEKVITDLLAELEHDKQVAQTELDEASAKKKRLTEEIGSSTAPPTGLHAKKEKAEHDVTQATQDLKDYCNRLDTLKAIHDVLTSAVIQQVKSQWQAGDPDPKDEGEFLNGTDGHSLKKKLENVRQSLNGTLSQEAVKRWADAVQRVDDGETRTAFEGYRALTGLSSLKRLELFDAFVAHIKELEAERVKQVAQFENVQRETQGVLDHITQKIDASKKEVAALDAQTKDSGKGKFETAKSEIGAVKAAVLKEVDRNRSYVFPKEVYAQIDTELKKIKTPESRTAQEILASRIPPPGMPPPDPSDYKSPSEVMDTVIALLRHHQMEAVARFGKDSTQAEKATEAIENAYRHRAGMIYSRPSSAYLRTSFPSTSLQDDPNLAWDNMLLKQGLRNLPFSSELWDILNPSGKQDRSITSELDKQYWQNINRVRVSGAGATNQALVKDDVGNWYVKQYFGKTDQIWESAKNLALFSMSAKAPIDLAKQLNKASTPKEYAENSKATPTLQKVLEKHQSAYQIHTDEIRAKLERLHDKELKETLIAAWDAHTDLRDDALFHGELQQALEAEIVVWEAVATTLKEKEGQDPGQAIVKDVGALARLGKMLSASITKISSSISSSAITQEEKDLEEKEKQLAKELVTKKDAPEAERMELDKKKEKLEAEKQELTDKKNAELENKKKKAVVEVHKVVGGQVTDILTDRNRALDQYEQAIVFIGDAANPKETKQGN